MSPLNELKFTPVFPGVDSVSAGVPVTVTGSLNWTVTGTTWPALYEPSASVELTLMTVGAAVSMTRFLFKPREPDAPGVGSVRSAALPAGSTMVPATPSALMLL